MVREDNIEHVFVQLAPNRFLLRPVTLGDEYGGKRVLLDGLRPGEKIVVDGAFHLNNERRRLALQTVRLSARGEGGIDAAAQLVVAAVAARLVSWDMCDAAGKPLAISPETVAALDPGLFENIYSAVAAFDDEEASAKN